MSRRSHEQHSYSNHRPLFGEPHEGAFAPLNKTKHTLIVHQERAEEPLGRQRLMKKKNVILHIGAHNVFMYSEPCYVGETSLPRSFSNMAIIPTGISQLFHSFSKKRWSFKCTGFNSWHLKFLSVLFLLDSLCWSCELHWTSTMVMPVTSTTSSTASVLCLDNFLTTLWSLAILCNSWGSTGVRCNGGRKWSESEFEVLLRGPFLFASASSHAVVNWRSKNQHTAVETLNDIKPYKPSQMWVWMTKTTWPLTAVLLDKVASVQYTRAKGFK